MDERSKRLVAAKKKLHQYKTQRQQQEKSHKGDPLNRSQESLASSLNDDEEHTTSTTTGESTISFNISQDQSLETTPSQIQVEHQHQQIISTFHLENNLEVKSNELPTTTTATAFNITPTLYSFEQSLHQIEDPQREEKTVILEKEVEKQFVMEPLYYNNNNNNNNNSDISISPQQSPYITENTLGTSIPTPQLVSMPSPINTMTYLQESPLILPSPTPFSTTTIEQFAPPSLASSLEQPTQQQQQQLLEPLSDKTEETNVNLQQHDIRTEQVKIEKEEEKNVIVTTRTETIEKSTQCENNEAEISKAQENFNDVIDNLQFELSKLRKENGTLLSRESELIQQLETGEKLVRDLRKEVNQFRQQGNAQKQLQELQDAIIVLSKSKMTIAEELNNEQDKNKELVDNLVTFENELKGLRSENSRLGTDMSRMIVKLKEEEQKNRILDDQRQQLGAQVEALKTKLHSLENTTTFISHEHQHQHKEEKEMIISSNSDGHHPSECHDHDHHHHHNGDDGHHHDDHDHTHTHSHEQEHSHDHPHGDTSPHGKHSRDLNHELVEMQKTLKRVNWENETYKAELLKLGPLKQLEPRFQELQIKNVTLKEEIDRLEHLVIQLQGENDTIGDYITLYQTQKLALRQHAKENDKLVAALSKERNDLLQKLTELNHAVDSLSKEKESTGKVIIEDKIRDLIVDVNSKVNETFTCSTCSGSRLMTV